MSFDIIPFYDEYEICKRTGEIRFTESKVPLKIKMIDGLACVEIRGEMKSVIDLLRYTYVSLHQIVWKIKKDLGTKTTLENIAYIIDPIHVDENLIRINGYLFKRLAEYPHYYISEDGTMYSDLNQIFMIKKYDCGYPALTIGHNIEVDGKIVYETKLHKIHRLVYCTWNDLPLYGEGSPEVIHHKDHNKYNSNLFNLESTDILWNTRYAIIEGKKPSQFDPYQIDEICKLYTEGYNYHEICKMVTGNDKLYKKVRDIIYRIKSRVCYVDLADKYNLTDDDIPSKYTLTEDQVKEICELIDEGTHSLNSIATKFNVSWMTIKKIEDGSRWKWITKDYNFTKSE